MIDNCMLVIAFHLCYIIIIVQAGVSSDVVENLPSKRNEKVFNHLVVSQYGISKLIDVLKVKIANETLMELSA